MAWIARLYGIAFSPRYLLLTNTVISITFEGLGDYLVQKVERAPKTDWERTKRMAIMGLLFGPPLHYWYLYLDKLLPGNSLAAVTKKVILDETIDAPIFTATFFVGLNKLSGESWSDSISDMRKKFWPVYKVDLMVWPLAQMLNFYLIPPQLRVTYINVIYLGWIMFLSHQQHKKQTDKIMT